MKKLQRRNNSNNLVVLNEKPEVVDVSRPTDLSSIHQERLHQSHIKFNFSITLIAMSATFCFTGVALFWSGNISEATAITTVDLVSRLFTSYCLPLIKSSQRQLDKLTEEEENDN